MHHEAHRAKGCVLHICMFLVCGIHGRITETFSCFHDRLLGMLDLTLQDVVSKGRQSVSAPLKSKKGELMQVCVNDLPFHPDFVVLCCSLFSVLIIKSLYSVVGIFIDIHRLMCFCFLLDFVIALN